MIPRNIAGLALANGTITTGRMHAGSTTPSSTNNHAQMDMSVEDKSNGTPYYAVLTNRPDSIAVWVKFISNDSATISAIITDGTYYQDPENKTYTNVYAKAKNAEIVSNNGVWQRISVPFTIQDENITPKGILVTISTNATPGAGNEKDVLYIDDLELIYTQTADFSASPFLTFTNVAAKNHKVVMPKGLIGYTLGVGADGNLCVVDTYLEGDVIPYQASLLLVGEPEKTYTFSTTLYENATEPTQNEDGRLVPATELNEPLDGYSYFYLANSTDGPLFEPATKGLKIENTKALMRVKKDNAAESYNQIIIAADPVGDINADGGVTIADVTSLVNRLLGKDSGEFIVPSADVNGDGTVTIADVTALVNILLGKTN
ncbi:MAG: dockerin type I repeat-containing protein [Prevotella sp.]|nr:dockerin type I repeat-containing protein [Prevotella sp.]